MGQVIHGGATTTEAIRRAILNSQASLRALSKRYGINQKTVAKWKKRTSVADLPTGPKDPKSTVLSVEEDATRPRGLRPRGSSIIHSALPRRPHRVWLTSPDLSPSAVSCGRCRRLG